MTSATVAPAEVPKTSGPPKGSRTVTVGVEPGPAKYVSNKIRTSKYTALTFVPKNLFEQLHKFGNVYFLVLSALMYAGERTTLFIGTIASFSTFGTLMMMMSITAMVALLDDRRRHAADNETNNRDAKILRINAGQVEEVTQTWQRVEVGNVVFVHDGEELPADMVPLFCSGDEGSCYVSTANLDGETNLKLKGAPALTSKLFGDVGTVKSAEQIKAARSKVFEKLAGVVVAVEAEAPSANIHDFQGSVADSRTGCDEPLDAKHLLLRGTVLRNTAFCVGVVVYTGSETRMVMNSRPAPLKRSNLERITNITMLLVLLAQGLLAVLSDIIYLATRNTYAKAWYLSTPVLLLPDWLSYWLTFFVLYSNMMPISLYPTMEFCNYWQTYFIKADAKMFYKDTQMPAGVRSSNLCQELGQVNYIFSDKTGTLTQNVMELKRVFIAGRFYGQMGKHKGFDGGHAMEEDRRDSVKAEEIDKFLEVLAVAHTVMASDGENGEKKYEAESPDESALVEATASVGWTFKDRVRNEMMVDVNVRDRMESLTYTVHGVNAFDSARKRQSVIVEHKGQFSLLVKGADNVMLERAANSSPQLESALQTFAEQGLRTLVIGRRSITKTEFLAWKEKYDTAAKTLGDRAGELAAVAETIEKELEIVGATAIEDKLQVGVPECIVKIRQAGVNLWVLTGDKLETARNIGFSSRVLDTRMTIAILDQTPETDAGSLRRVIDEKKAELDRRKTAGEKALMVTGPALSHILKDPEVKTQFLNLAKTCSIVIACRVSPMQKAEMVRLVRENVKPTPVTLAIGDGANDVPMIQEAQVGVGIAGREGRQAVNNADFAIGQFAYLERLLLVHGRWNYRRACKFTLFTFWRNAIQVLCIFYYTVPSGFSGTCLFEDWLRLSFNFLCSFPIMATGIFDQDVPDYIAVSTPKLYEIGREGMDLNGRNMLKALHSALVHSAVILFFAALSLGSLEVLGAGDYYTFGTTVFTLLLIDINCRVACLNHTHNRYTVGTIFISFALYVIFVLVYTSSPVLTAYFTPGMHMVGVRMASTPTFWLSCLAVPTVTMTLDATVLMAYRTRFKRWDELAHLRDKISGKLQGTSIWIPDDSNTRELASKCPGIVVTPFSQQQRQGLFFWSSLAVLRVISCCLGLVLLFVGIAAVSEARGVKQIVVAYDGSPGAVYPPGTEEDEIFHRKEAACHDDLCEIDIEVKHALKAPILVYYAVGPFYQSYNDYMKSQVQAELMGKTVTEEKRQSSCRAENVRVRDGKQIVPCGAPVTSMFNDTFEFTGVVVDTQQNVGWSSDIDRLNNPSDYLLRENTLWVPDLYPDTIDQAQGVKDPRFVEWLRPGATPYLKKRYGWVNKELREGDTFTVAVENRFNAVGFGGYKYLVLTEVGAFGGRDISFGAALIVGGLVTLVLGAALCGLQAFRRKSFEEESEPNDDAMAVPILYGRPSEEHASTYTVAAPATGSRAVEPYAHIADDITRRQNNIAAATSGAGLPAGGAPAPETMHAVASAQPAGTDESEGDMAEASVKLTAKGGKKKNTKRGGSKERGEKKAGSRTVPAAPTAIAAGEQA